MVRIEVQSRFPAPLPVLWRSLELHLDERLVHRIHPSIVSQIVRENDGSRAVFERQVNYYGRVSKMVWHAELEPPGRFDWEILESESPIRAGTRVSNRYEARDGGTTIRTEAEFVLQEIPSLVHGIVARFILNTADREDLAFLRREGYL